MVSAHETPGLRAVTDETWTVLEGLAHALHVKNAELQPTLDAIVSTALDTIDSARYVGLILVVHGELVPQATTGDPPHVLDLLQQELGAGPCIDAGRGQVVVRIGDMAVERRWPVFAERAVSLGVVSMLCVPLRVDEWQLGTLSLYSERADAFSEQDLGLTRLFATHAAMALSDVRRTEQLQAALRNRDLIGQAKGILMERHRVTADEAFRRLADASQRANVKLTTIAQHLVDAGELPGADSA